MYHKKLLFVASHKWKKNTGKNICIYILLLFVLFEFFPTGDQSTPMVPTSHFEISFLTLKALWGAKKKTGDTSWKWSIVYYRLFCFTNSSLNYYFFWIFFIFICRIKLKLTNTRNENLIVFDKIVFNFKNIKYVVRIIIIVLGKEMNNFTHFTCFTPESFHLFTIGKSSTCLIVYFSHLKNQHNTLKYFEINWKRVIKLT